MKLPAAKRRAARIEMVPLIDVVFLLLVFFTYSMLSMIVPRGLKVRLPSVGASSRTGREPVAVTIGRRGELYVDREPVARGELVESVRDRVSGEPGAWVLIHGDARAPLESALDVMGLLRDGGIGQVTFRTTAPRPAGLSPDPEAPTPPPGRPRAREEGLP